MQKVVTLDLEGVLIPEIWQLVSKKTSIERLSLTTRDISDYDELMQIRLDLLREHNLTIKDIQEVIKTVEPLEGAIEFFKSLREKVEVIILSDTFIEFFMPLREKLLYPTIFCNSLDIDEESHAILQHKMRIIDGKSEAVRALKSINSIVAASGDSYNDLGMLKEADYGIWFRPPASIIEKHPEFPATNDFEELKEKIFQFLDIV